MRRGGSRYLTQSFIISAFRWSTLAVKAFPAAYCTTSAYKVTPPSQWFLVSLLSPGLNYIRIPTAFPYHLDCAKKLSKLWWVPFLRRPPREKSNP